MRGIHGTETLVAFPASDIRSVLGTLITAYVACDGRDAVQNKNPYEYIRLQEHNYFFANPW